MELKRILAKDSRTAMDMAMSQYGKDVLVVSSQSVGGQVELVVALEVAPPQPEPPAEQAAPSAFSQAFQRALGPMSEPDAQESAAPPAASEVPRSAADILAARKARQAMQTAQAIQAAQRWQAARSGRDPEDAAAAQPSQAALATQAAQAALAAQNAQMAADRSAEVAQAEETARAAKAEQAAQALQDAQADEAEEAERAAQAQETVRSAQAAQAAQAARAPKPPTAPEPGREVRGGRGVRGARATRATVPPLKLVETAPAAGHEPAASCPPTAAGDARTCPASQAQGQQLMELVRREIAALRQEFALGRQVQAWQDGRQWPESVRPVIEALQDAGVPAGLRALLSDELQAATDVPGAIRAVRRVMEGALADLPTVAIGRGLHAICGPSGAGKTHMVTRLARVAALHLNPERVAIITFNDSRTGAWSQSRALAAQAGVDCFRASDLSTLRLLVEDLRDRSVILIDTAGADCQAQAAQLRDMGLGIETHLLLPADASIGSVKLLLGQPDAWRSLMVCKVDESHSPWPVIQALSDRRVPVSCMSLSSDVKVQARTIDPSRILAAGFARLQADLGLTATAAVTSMNWPDMTELPAQALSKGAA